MKTLTKIEIAISTLVLIMIIGTVSYHYLEGWTYVDSFYFTGVTMTTVGYGDLHPTSNLSKIFTVLFAFAGIGITLFTVSLLATQYFETREKRFGIQIERRFLEDLKKNFNMKVFRKRRRAARKEILKGTRF